MPSQSTLRSQHNRLKNDKNERQEKGTEQHRKTNRQKKNRRTQCKSEIHQMSTVIFLVLQRTDMISIRRYIKTIAHTIVLIRPE